MLEIFILPIALSIDASIVSFSYGLVVKNKKLKISVLLAFSTAIFQMIMPFLGVIFAKSILSYIEKFAVILASLIFIILGIKFIFDTINNNENKLVNSENLSFTTLLVISIGTSIDALAAGINLCFLKIPTNLCILLIGIVTFLNSLLGFWIGHFFKQFPAKIMTILSGILLILLGIKKLF